MEDSPHNEYGTPDYEEVKGVINQPIRPSVSINTTTRTPGGGSGYTSNLVRPIRPQNDLIPMDESDVSLQNFFIYPTSISR